MGAPDRIGWQDVWLPVLLLALGAAELASLGTDGWLPSVGLEAVAAGLLVLRRRYAALAVPAEIVVLALVPATGTAMNDVSAPILFIVVGLFALGRHTGLRTGTVVLTGSLVTALVLTTALGPGAADPTDAVFILSLGVPPFVFGRIVRRLDEQSRQLAAQQELIREQAVRAERDRIARELHDVIAHSISAMVVQTAAAQDLVRTDPARAAELLQSVADTGRAALAETGRLLHLVRDDAGELGLAPAPTARDLRALVESFRGHDREIDAELDLPEQPLPGGVDVSTYRVVQEALTNASKHAAGPVRLRVTSSPDCLRIRCSNAVAARAGEGSGLGLRGMAERVHLLGGTMHAGPTAEGDFVLEVDLPLAGVST